MLNFYYGFALSLYRLPTLAVASLADDVFESHPGSPCVRAPNGVCVVPHAAPSPGGGLRPKPHGAGFGWFAGERETNH